MDASTPPSKLPQPRKRYRPATELVRGGLARSGFSETSEALYLTSGYVYGSAEEAEQAFINDGSRFVYSRFANPTVSVFEERLRLLEGAEACRGVASGMAAVFAAMMPILKAGDRVVASRSLFGSCHHIIANILPRYGIGTVFVDGRDLDAWRDALKSGVTVTFVESPSNPTLEVIDIAAVAKLTHEAGGRLIVDNVFATPLLQKPLEFGADIVVYSATKHIDGQGRTLGGAILGSEKYVREELAPFLRHTGPALSPFNAWVLLKGLETLALRVDKQCASALEVARFLTQHPAIERSLYPGLESHPQHALAMSQMTLGGTVIAITPKGGKEGAFRLMNRLELIDISNNLGDAKSLMTHPTTTTHAKLPDPDKQLLGITPGLLRLSVGLEDLEDLKEDLAQALDGAPV